jgi:hypothetical protein
MTVTQIIDIPADRRVHFDYEFPLEIPVGKARVTVTPIVEPPQKAVPPFSSFVGSHKGLGTTEDFLARKRADKADENAQIARRLGLDELPKIKKEGK